MNLLIFVDLINTQNDKSNRRCNPKKSLFFPHDTTLKFILTLPPSSPISPTPVCDVCHSVANIWFLGGVWGKEGML